MSLLEKIRSDPELVKAELVVKAAQDVADFLRGARKSAGFTQGELAEKLGVSQARISQVESGKVESLPAYDFIVLFAHECGTKFKIAENERETAEEPVLPVRKILAAGKHERYATFLGPAPVQMGLSIQSGEIRAVAYAKARPSMSGAKIVCTDKKLKISGPLPMHYKSGVPLGYQTFGASGRKRNLLRRAKKASSD